MYIAIDQCRVCLDWLQVILKCNRRYILRRGLSDLRDILRRNTQVNFNIY